MRHLILMFLWSPPASPPAAPLALPPRSPSSSRSRSGTLLLSGLGVSSAKLNQASATSEECTVACEFIEAVEAKSSSSSGYGSMVSVHGYLEEVPCINSIL
ncbi:uncharacterized protein [Arachis hypogaea]|uniref:uncharacterized protein isoform X1 n=1 Tax=Arachis hypogaea TaxID=3818 RepID=UPI003B223CA4